MKNYHEAELKELFMKKFMDGEIEMVLLSPKNDKVLLDKIPHRTVMGDLALGYRIALVRGKEKDICSYITNAFMELAGISEEQLYWCSSYYTQSLGCCFRPLDEIVLEMMVGDPKEVKTKESLLYLVSNRAGVYGSSQILLVDNLKMIAEELAENFYILPSSKHEVLVVKKSVAKEVQFLKELVKSVNRTEVSEKDYLSDSVYECDSKTLEIRVVA